MTLYSTGSFTDPDDTAYFVTGVVSDVFVTKADDNTYHFCGLTKTEKGYEFNDRFSWKEYYALGDDQGLGIARVEPDQWKLVLLNKGKEEISVECDYGLWRPGFNRKSALLHISGDKYKVAWPYDPGEWSSWTVTNECLQNISSHNTQAVRLLSILQEWESISVQTIDWVKTQIKSGKRRTVEICAVGHWWIWLDQSERVVTMGMGEQEWGKALLPSHLSWARFNWASPVRHGWLADFSHGERYLIHWNGRNVAIRPLVFPCGEWKKQGQWILWPDDYVIFTPNKQLVVTEPWFEIIGTSKQWVFLKPSWNRDMYTTKTNSCFKVIDKDEQRVFLGASRLPKDQIKAIDQSGNLLTTTLPLEHNEKPEEIYVGDRSMLIITLCKGARVLTIADISNLPPRPRLRTILFRNTGGYVIYVLRGNPDAYAILSQESKSTLVRVLVIDAWGRAWLASQVLSLRFLPSVLNTIKVKGDQLIIDLVDEQRNPTGYNLVIEMKDGTGTIYFPDGITASRKGVELENDLTALEKYLLQHVPNI